MTDQTYEFDRYAMPVGKTYGRELKSENIRVTADSLEAAMLRAARLSTHGDVLVYRNALPALIAAAREAERREESDMQLIQERDEAEEAASELYAAVMGPLPEWSNHFGYRDALEAVQSELQARAEAADAENKRLREALPDDIRAQGWTVAVHNDYRLNGETHTFWLFTSKDGRAVKGEGRTDAEALNAVRAVLSPTQDKPAETVCHGTGKEDAR